MSDGPERISTGPAARIVGVTNKTLLRLARHGKVPGAVELDKGLWRFDERRLRNWVRRREAECQRNEARKISFNATGYGTPEFRLADATSNEAYERLFSRKPKSGARRS
jgi:hypothetical protein